MMLDGHVEKDFTWECHHCGERGTDGSYALMAHISEHHEPFLARTIITVADE